LPIADGGGRDEEDLREEINAEFRKKKKSITYLKKALIGIIGLKREDSIADLAF
jgi:hypothetical protein